MADVVDESSELERLAEILWALQPAFQSGWNWQSDGVRPTHLGSAGAWQTRMGLHADRWRIGLIADKDRGEPWGTGRIPWTGPELKRVFVSRDGNRFDVLAGNFRVQQGFGLISGRRTASLPSKTSPLGLPNRLASARGYAGSASGALRRGAMAGLEGWRAVLRLWKSAGNTTASIASLNQADALPLTVIRDISGTGAFATESSVRRRSGISLSSTGIQTALAGSKWQVAGFAEHTRTTLRPDVFPDSSSITELPNSLLLASLAWSASLGPFDIASEHGVVSGGPFSRRTALRWKRGRSGVILDATSMNTERSGPFSSHGRFYADYSHEAILKTGARWYRSPTSDWVLRGIQRQRRVEEGSLRMHQLAVDWSRSVASGSGNRPASRVRMGINHRREGDIRHQTDTITRVQIHYELELNPIWAGHTQIQLGYRSLHDGSRGGTGLLGLTIHRSARKSAEGRRTSPAVPDWSVLLLTRFSGQTGTVLYAIQPAPAGGFPVLAGSASAIIMAHRLRWKPSPAVTGDLMIRTDRYIAPREPTYSMRFGVQLRIAL